MHEGIDDQLRLRHRQHGPDMHRSGAAAGSAGARGEDRLWTIRYRAGKGEEIRCAYWQQLGRKDARPANPLSGHARAGVKRGDEALFAMGRRLQPRPALASQHPRVLHQLRIALCVDQGPSEHAGEMDVARLLGVYGSLLVLYHGKVRAMADSLLVLPANSPVPGELWKGQLQKQF